MFFSLSEFCDDRFPNNYKLNNGKFFNCDNGWRVLTVDSKLVIFKGYADNGDLQSNINELLIDPTPKHQGNFAVLICNSNACTLTHDVNRGFPLWWDPTKKELSNLDKHSHKIYANTFVTVDNDLHYHKFNPFNVSNTLDKLTLSVVLDKLENILLDKVNLLKNKTVKIYPTGGVDTMLLLSLIRNQGINYELIDYEFFAYDEFVCKNIQQIRNDNWAYRQLHHWKKQELLCSGTPGDEFFMRGPDTLATWAAWHNIDVLDALKNKPPGYHTGYFLKEKNQKIFSSQFKQKSNDFPTEGHLNCYILNKNINDHQHWHIGNTLTWTPLKDIRITEILLSLNKHDFLEQIIDATVTKKLIERFDDSLLQYISPTKNLDGRFKICELCKNV